MDEDVSMSSDAPSQRFAPAGFSSVEEHARRYLESGGTVGYEWEGATIVVIEITGRRSGRVRPVPLIKVTDGDRYLLVASKGGAPAHPEWYLNLLAEPRVVVHDRGESHPMTARTASAGERAALWPRAVAQWPAFDDYVRRTDREIPLVICEPRP